MYKSKKPQLWAIDWRIVVAIVLDTTACHKSEAENRIPNANAPFTSTQMTSIRA